ncbi:MAG: hypothetical protein CFH34_01339 [Alphaproteobacteria bacterium MarineAlpha9_Bin4]|nr:MAG: hypothetical protein CFH34_01339 [Alphaproteobacteria bacterium MarineAlpha9_Bin4]
MIIKKILKRIFLKTSIYDFYLSKNNPTKILVTPHDPWPGDPSIGESIFQGDFNLSSKKKEILSQKLLWKINNNKDFWKEEIHTFSWLRHLKARSGSLARKHARKLILDWLEKNSKWNEDTWKLDIVARRISSWTTNLSFLLAEQDEEFASILNLNLQKQIKHLNIFTTNKTLERFNKNNDDEDSSIKKFKILRGLILSGICFEGGEDRYRKSINLLENAIANDFNEDGVHVSRLPSSQLSILADLVTMRDIIIAAKYDAPEFLVKQITKSSHSLRFFRVLDGTLSTFSGSKRETKFVIDKILNVADGKARGKGPLTLSNSGYTKLLVPNACIIIDSLSAKNKIYSTTPHAIEIYVGKCRLLGSCGSSFSKNNEWKKILRSTAAHSTVTLEESDAFMGEDKNQKSFTKRYTKNGSEILELIHYGYFNRYLSICSRKIELGKDGKNIAGLDKIESKKLSKFCIRFHFSPEIKISLSLDKQSVVLATKDQGWRFLHEGEARLSLDASIFIEDDGTIKNTFQIVLSGSTKATQTNILWGFTRIS